MLWVRRVGAVLIGLVVGSAIWTAGVLLIHGVCSSPFEFIRTLACSAAPPLDAEHLQVVLDLDDPKGWVVARWRDLYADHGQMLEVDMCLEHLTTNQRLCWNCGDLGAAERDDLLWCVACLEMEKKR